MKKKKKNRMSERGMIEKKGMMLYLKKIEKWIEEERWRCKKKDWNRFGKKIKMRAKCR